MGLFDFLKKKKDNNIVAKQEPETEPQTSNQATAEAEPQASNQTSTETQTDNSLEEYMKHFSTDKAEWQYESCFEAYLKANNKTEDDLTEEDEDRILESSCLMIAYFITWLINNNYLASDISQEDINAVKERKIKTTKILPDDFDCTLLRDDISEEILDFVDEYYYKKYTPDSVNVIQSISGKDIFLSEFTWETYDKMEELINKAFAEYKNK